ncbi:DUF3422 family protein [Aromatoleum anaerobium]|uniref:DUF3422 family protein n=1 Tax=Aromatoleum anaerobium TaxID=182180 RepID=A0ABX1PPP9_9RHOO|nr:DUF3422 domain-containing protein [Aromatoleum anaerobium]MCK0506901.1 DUF3422 domain-containing protein [Aromatoleum anaerobium]
MPLFEEHPQRRALNDEVHSRPPVPLNTPELVSYLAFLHVDGSADLEAAHLHQLAAQLGLPEPSTDTGHVSLDAGEFRLRWERHSEFSSYTFFRHGADHALLAVPAGWRKGIPGQLIVATQVEVRDADDIPAETVIAQDGHGFTPTVASQIAGGAGWVLTDFRIVEGFSRFVVFNRSLTPRQAGRSVQRLVEIETYRVMALLAFPVAKDVGRLLARAEGELADLMDNMGNSTSTDDERRVLNRLTRLAAEVERSVARTTFRFGAAAAYYQLVRQRIEDLREVRLDGYPPIREFMDRRLAPAIATCATMARRQEDLSGRIARNSQLLRTRVDIELERQNQELLAQMNRRAKLQLRLQETVEGLSVVAITYYASQLVQYLAKGGKDYLAPATPEVITAVSIPIIAGLVALGLRRMRRQLAAEEAVPGH